MIPNFNAYNLINESHYKNYLKEMKRIIHMVK